MLNLLFISDSPKIENIKSFLQPVLKVIIDVVADFDQGLKNVFEKRPTTVCIQDHIGGVTGESVARHIQMLLGNNAPTFILLHSGNGNAKAVKGLYEHLINLDQSNEAVAENIKNTLKLILGSQWAKVFIPPKQTASSVKSAVSVPEESREDADKLVDDLLSDLETSGFLHLDNVPSNTLNADSVANVSSTAAQIGNSPESEKVLGTVISEKIQSTSDEMADLLLAQANKPFIPDRPVELKKLSTATTKPSTPLVALPASNVSDYQASSTSQPDSKAKIKSEQIVVPPVNLSKTSATPLKNQPPAVVPQAAEFVINQPPPPKEHIPEDLLMAFEDNYRSESRFFNRTVVLALLLVVSAGAGWYFLKHDTNLPSLLKQPVVSSASKTAAPVVSPVVVPVKKSLPQPVAPVIVATTLPQFIPKEGHDSSYAAKNPGWERYVGKQAEFRLFTVSGQIKAVQVLAVKNSPISNKFIKLVLQEFTGSPEYQITSQKKKAGFNVSSGRIQKKNEILIYKKSGVVKAFVVSLN